MTTDHNNQRTAWPFLYQGMKQEYPDSWKLYREANGSVYNPDPFQLSLDGPQGLGGGGSFPRAIGGHGGGGSGDPRQQFKDAERAIDALDQFAYAADASPGPGPYIAAALQVFNMLNDWFNFTGEDGPTIPLYNQIHSQHGRHQIYSVVGIAPGLIVTQSSALQDASPDDSGSTWWLRYIRKLPPLAASGIIPVRVLAYVGFAGSVTYIPHTNTVCIGGGLGVCAGRSFSVGPLLWGNLANAKAISKGWSVSGAYSGTWYQGAQATANSSGFLAGLILGVRGGSLALTYGFCFDL